MRLVCVIFSILFLLAGLDAGSALVDSDKAYINRRAPTAERHLRSTSEARNDKSREERAGTSSVQHIADKMIAKLMEKMSMNPSSIFSRLRFGEAGAKLSSNNKALVAWLQYANKFMATKGTEQFSTHHLFTSYVEMLSRRGDLAQLFQSLSRVKGMKDLGHTMQLYMFQASKSTRNVMNTVWLQALETPAEVFTTLRLADNTFENFNRPNLIGWLRYSKDYSKSVGFSTKDTLDLLMKAPHKRDTDFGLLFLSLKKESSIQKDAGVMKLVEKLQAQLFKNWMDSKMTPDLIAGRVVSSATTNWERVFSLPITDPKFKLVEEYTLKYAANEGGDLLARVQKLFEQNKPVDALKAAMAAT